ncbi:methyltransferase [Sphingomonas sp. Leaf412]|uniref:class I SAM-dependent methyltransferase n=1 Tax=Sphingomonas sp. Leaf412 TaxID=1736370 RepID=UPI0006F4D354|nr:class I SAM-dependent methyltransferase [Sphingomonas sp. Leaf412]KQT32288.1 methyltransferase [Sphingomonas sp. Leaf412]
MTFRPLFAIAAVAGAGVAAYAAAPQARDAAPDAAVTRAIANPARSEANRARDAWRHPAQTLAFFGVTPAKKVVEFIPGGGWYSEILATIPAKGGSYTALVTPRSVEGTTKMLAEKKLTGTVATLDGATGASTVPANSQDVVLTFRNIHNLTMGGGTTAANAFKAWFTMLKPGGTLGIVEHRLPEGADTALEAKSGYLKTSTVVKLAEAAGFRPAGASEVNANPKDTHDHPEGVWTLPPTYRLGDVDRAKYAAIGESDRMTLRFVKPK